MPTQQLTLSTTCARCDNATLAVFTFRVLDGLHALPLCSEHWRIFFDGLGRAHDKHGGRGER